MEKDVGAMLFVARTNLDRARLACGIGRNEEAERIAAEVESAAEGLHLDAPAGEARRVGESARKTPPASATGPPGRALSAREREVLALVSNGSSNKDIAGRLVISVNTVERHLANIYTKLGVRGRAEAAVFAVRSGIVEGGGIGGLP